MKKVFLIPFMSHPPSMIVNKQTCQYVPCDYIRKCGYENHTFRKLFCEGRMLCITDMSSLLNRVIMHNNVQYVLFIYRPAVNEINSQMPYSAR